MSATTETCRWSRHLFNGCWLLLRQGSLSASGGLWVQPSSIKQCWVLAELPLHLHACRGRTRLKRPRSMVTSRCTSGAGPTTYLQHVSCCRAILWRLNSQC